MATTTQQHQPKTDRQTVKELLRQVAAETEQTNASINKSAQKDPDFMQAFLRHIPFFGRVDNTE